MLKEYNYKSIEEKWIKIWLEKKIYKFVDDKNKPTYSIDTPPPYPSGELSPGNAFNYVYCDTVARYVRMKGYNVHFPIGFDCHGLPTEVRVENLIKKKKSEMDWKEFYNLCVKYTRIWVEEMEKSFKRLGISFDWDLKYLTMDPNYWKRTQLSFIISYKKGYIYRGEHPVFWCPRCETAIAEAEVEDDVVKKELYYINYKLKDGNNITIATTRPELLGACVAVAVNPNDERYSNYLNKIAIVPIYEREVPIITSDEVDPSFGTGAMMICTYGDKGDVRVQKKNNLPVIIIIDDKGRFNSYAGKILEGLSILEGRKKIVEELRNQGYLIKTEIIDGEIRKCWRCHSLVEIIPKKQWFFRSLALSEKILEIANKIKWIPPYQIKRLQNWINSLSWDWVISRQRVFATVIPAWYCKNCNEVIVAEEDWVPVDPRLEKPKIEKCPKCGGNEFVGENDVLDTWMDSSITCAVHAGWPDNFDPRLFPADLQPNGYDIIRTWDYYLLLRHYVLFNNLAFKTALINGMVRGTDGRMMHKSYGNVIPLDELLDRYGVDAFRLWALSSVKVGSDVSVRFEDLDFNKRFLNKLWNAARYVITFTREVKEIPKIEKLIDLWILNELQNVINKVNMYMEEMDFFNAVNEIRTFIWNKFCDQYLEAVKYRTAMNDEVAFYVLRYTLEKILLLLAPFAPFITEEIYHNLKENVLTIHLEKYPEHKEINEVIIKRGEILTKTIAELRRIKLRLGISLAENLSKVTIYAKNFFDIIKENYEDIKHTLRINEMEVLKEGEGKYKSEELENVSYDIVV
jgi:valyl-tRNA synthetase